MKTKKLLSMKQKMVQVTGSVFMLLNSIPVRVAAAQGGTGTGIEKVDAILSSLKTLFLGIVGGIGIVILIKGVADMAQAYQQQDSHGMYDGAKGLVAGGIMVAIGPILAAFGIA